MDDVQANPPTKRMRRLPGHTPVAEWLDPFASVWATAKEHAARIGVPYKTMRRRLLDPGPTDPNCWRGEDIRCVMVRDPEGAVRSIEGHAAHYGIRPDTLKHRGAKWGWHDQRTWSRDRVSPGPALMSKRPRYDKPRPKKPARLTLTPEQRKERKRVSQARWREKVKANRLARGLPARATYRKPNPPPPPVPPTLPEPTPPPPTLHKDTWRNPFPTLAKPKAEQAKQRTAEEDLRAWADECGFGRHLS